MSPLGKSWVCVFLGIVGFISWFWGLSYVIDTWLFAPYLLIQLFNGWLWGRVKCPRCRVEVTRNKNGWHGLWPHRECSGCGLDLTKKYDSF